MDNDGSANSTHARSSWRSRIQEREQAMRKIDEARDPNSCLNKAGPHEMLFILLGRDPAAPVAIRSWIAERIRLHLNVPSDKQIMSALESALIMEKEAKP